MSSSSGPNTNRSKIGDVCHVFKESGTFTPSFTGTVEVLVVAGGGGGGTNMGGGGGGGGVISDTSYSVTAGTPITVTVGAGGAGAPAGLMTHPAVYGDNGGNSVFGTLTAIGGGAGGLSPTTNGYGVGKDGGSGGGGTGYNNSGWTAGTTGGGAGTAGQGNRGGHSGSAYYSGGGGGAGSAGVDGNSKPNGGDGILNNILGIDYYWGAGGGGAAYSSTLDGGDGGLGGGGGGAIGPIGGLGGTGGYNLGHKGVAGLRGNQSNLPGGDAGEHTGSGGGAGSHYRTNNKGGDGGSGIVIVRYPSSLGSAIPIHNVIRPSLVFSYDMDNTKKSWKGAPMTNLMKTISPSNLGVSTGFASYVYTETDIIPELGEVTVYRNNIQNNYTSYTPNSAQSAPNLFTCGAFAISPSTLYTYGIVYKCDSGYTSANYMYRYEYVSNGGALAAQGGVFNASNQVELGNGWYYAWGTFTTTATSTWMGSTGFYYYRYSQTPDNTYMAKSMIVEGDWSGLHPKFWPDQDTTRSNTEAILDLTGTQTATIENLTYNTDGTFEFDGTDNKFDLGNPVSLQLGSNFSIEAIVRPDEDKWMYFFYKGYGTDNCLSLGRHVTTDGWFFSTYYNTVYNQMYFGEAVVGEWYHLTVTYDKINFKLYQNGVLRASPVWTEDVMTNSATVGIGGGGRYWHGKIDMIQIYNKVLSDNEVKNNFNAYRSRYNL